MRVCNLTTPANYFHALRRQLKANYRKPLVLMTPKSLLRHKLAVSSLSEFGPDSAFQRVIPEIDATVPENEVRRVVLCTGKVYYDLLQARRDAGVKDVAILRHRAALRLSRRRRWPGRWRPTRNAEVVWCQEEPENMGAWTFVDRRIEAVLRGSASRRSGRNTPGATRRRARRPASPRSTRSSRKAWWARRSASTARRARAGADRWLEEDGPAARTGRGARFRTRRRRRRRAPERKAADDDRDCGSDPGRKRQQCDGGALAQAGGRGGGGGRAAGGARDRQGHGGGHRALRRGDREHRRRHRRRGVAGRGARGDRRRRRGTAAAKPAGQAGTAAAPTPPPTPAPADAAPAQPRVETPRAPSGPVAVPGAARRARAAAGRCEDDGREAGSPRSRSAPAPPRTGASPRAT